MYAQLQARYPTASLVSELLQVQAGNFVVRVVIQVGGVTLTTGMAASPSIEQAEDQARLRALAVLDIHPSTESQADLIRQPEVISELKQATPGVRGSLPGHQTGLNQSSFEQRLMDRSVPEAPPLQAAPQPSLELELLSQTDSDSQSPEPKRLELANQARGNGRGRLNPNYLVRQGNNGRANPEVPLGPERVDRNSPSATQPSRSTSRGNSLPTPIDLSEAIAETSVELKRLGWSNDQGRDYLQRTYGKRSRSSLTDEELLEFLQYLQAQPAADEPSF